LADTCVKVKPPIAIDTLRAIKHREHATGRQTSDVAAAKSRRFAHVDNDLWQHTPFFANDKARS
jgi:hypothetical protein